MSTTYTRAPKKTRRGQSFAVVLFVIIYIAQSALALVVVSCSHPDCGTVSESCCFEAPLGVSAPAIPSETCCGSDGSEADTQDGARPNECNCRVDSAPFPAPDPALPPRMRDATDNGSLGAWVRAHASLSANTPSGPPGVHLLPRAGDGNEGYVPPHGTIGNPLARRVSSAGVWMLLMRGVAGFLALLSVARN